MELFVFVIMRKATSKSEGSVPYQRLGQHTGSFRKNDKSKSRSKGVNFYKILILSPFPGRKIATNYSPTPSRSLRNVLRLPSKVAPPTLAE